MIKLGQIRQSLWDRRDLILLASASGALLAFMVRYPLLPFESKDYKIFFGPWYDFIIQHGSFAALKHPIGNYNAIYYYLLATIAVLLPGVDKLFAIKMLHITFDFALAYFVYLCVRLNYPKGMVPVLAALVTLFAPTVLVNSAFWGQCDAIYTTFLVACLYCLLSGRQAWAFIAFGLAFSLKLQAIFLAPCLLWLLAAGKSTLALFSPHSHSLFNPHTARLVYRQTFPPSCFDLF